MVHRQVAEHACLYLYLLGVCFPLHLVARLKFLAVHYVETLEHVDALLVEVAVEDYRT